MGRPKQERNPEIVEIIVNFRKKHLSIPDIKILLDAWGYNESEGSIYRVCDENGLVRLTCETQGELFGDCQFYDKYPCNAGDFVVKFMSSYIAEDMDGDLSPYHTWDTQQLFDEMF